MHGQAHGQVSMAGKESSSNPVTMSPLVRVDTRFPAFCPWTGGKQIGLTVSHGLCNGIVGTNQRHSRSGLSRFCANIGAGGSGGDYEAYLSSILRLSALPFG
jgi:hypothetical protein